MSEFDLVVKNLLEAAKHAASSDPIAAERLYRQALKQSEIVYGADNVGVCLTIFELADFYELQGRMDEVKPLRVRMREIMTEYSKRLSSGNEIT